MMNEQEHGESMQRIRKSLFDHVSILSMGDFKAANKNRKAGQKAKPYSLSPNTQEAHEVYSLACKPVWTDSDENRIKAYRMTNIVLAG